MDLKEPMSINEQVAQLKKHGVCIEDERAAKQILSDNNYYRFTGYALQYRGSEFSDDYIPNTSFDSVWRISRFDAALRCLLKGYLDIVELHTRTQIAYGFSLLKCKIPPCDQHYNPANFYNKESHKTIIISSLDREKEHNRDSLFVIHHMKKYNGKMPLWVIVELLSFTNLSKLYSSMYFSEQDHIAINMGTSGPTLRNHLHCMANLRNKVAHAGRLYNAAYNPPAVLGRPFLKRNPTVNLTTLFSYLVVLIRRIPQHTDKKEFAKQVRLLVREYCDCIELELMGFPENYGEIFDRECRCENTA